MGYTATDNGATGGVENHVFVARSTSPSGGFQKWNGSGWGGSPQPFISFTGTAGSFGAGEPSFVSKDDTLYIYYTWSDATVPIETRVATASASDPDWPASLTHHGKAINSKDPGEDQTDVKYVDAYDKFIAVSVAERFGPDSYLHAWESSDGLNFSPLQNDNITENIVGYAHNAGISGTPNGHFDVNDNNFVSIAHGPIWGQWSNQLVPIDITAALPPVADITSNLIGHWKMDDLSGTIAADSAGTNHGTLVGPPNPTFVATGKHDGAVEFQGGDGAGYVDIGDDAVLNLTGSRTVSAWIKVDQWSGTANPNYWDAIVTKGDVPGNYDLIRDGVSDRMGFYVADTGEFIASSEGVADGEWHLITGVYDVAGTISLYVDGVLDVSMVVDGGLTTTNNASLRINGLDKAGREENRHMDGQVDDVRLYDRALSAVDVAKLYSLHSVPESSTLGMIGLAGLVFALRRKV